MIKHETIEVTIEVSGVVIYCDKCGARGHEEAYDNINELVLGAQLEGWTQESGGEGYDRDRDICKDCSAKMKKKK